MLQDGAYGRLLDTYYAHEKALPLNLSTLYAMARANTPEERSAVDLIIAQFFKKTRWGYTQKRAAKEMKIRAEWRNWQKNHREKHPDINPDSKVNVRPMSRP